jgi:hypothetical protein
MSAPREEFSKNPTLALRSVLFASLTSVTLCNAVWASETEDAIKLYESNRYAAAVLVFEKVQQETMRDSRSAYYYALSLNSLGHTPKAITVCKQIIRRFPKTEAARQAKVAIDQWPRFNFVSNASAESRANIRAMGRIGTRGAAKLPIDMSLGILGFKFEMLKGQRPRVKVVFPETPAAKFLKPDDLIMFVAGTSTAELTKEEVYDLLVGDANTTVSVTVQRNGQLITSVLTRVAMGEFAKLHPEVWQQYLRYQ